ncbi:MAG: ribosome-associated translation inhibitor RaiA [Alphaproteobacteria bacterium]|nr:ribosome-associated translation inhibitor RaiA [Alphaproteobacteria bacterium]MBU0834981.1 ribosome-associated translation inhibitor RaiA [Alphaproteobacteria bacterium]MBU1763422.1 ribosome-associated translation inhibitor RaiA [Alphaproteobacteria bacterium]
MSVRVSGKQMEIGETFRQRIEDRIQDAVTKYFDGGYSGQVVVSKSQSRFAADCLVHLDTGANLHAAGEANDPQVAFDTAFERVEKRLRRYKRKLKDHHAGEAQNPSIEIAYTVMDSVDEDHEELPEDYAPTIVAESTKKLRTMSVASAVMALDMTDDPVLLFRNPGSEQLNIVYRRNDGNIGWIDSANIKG